MYASFGATVGAVIVFCLVRYYAHDWIQKKYAVRLESFNREWDRNGHWYLLSMQLLPFTPTPFINLLAGLTTISLWTFVWTTYVGILPGTLVYTLIGTQLYKITSVDELMSCSLFILFVLAALLVLVLPIMIQRLRD